MTAAFISYNGSTGDDQNGGGGGTVVTGVSGDISGTTITLNETVDMSDNAVGDVIWYGGNAGDRHLFTVASFTGGRSTCTAVVVDQTATGARTTKAWGIGGSRLSVEDDTSNTDFDDQEDGWVYEFEESGASGEYDLTATINITEGAVADGHVQIRAASGASPTLKWTGDFAAITVSGTGYLKIVGMAFSNTTSTSANCHAVHVEQNGSLWMSACTGDTYGSWIYAVQARKLLVYGCTLTASGSGTGIEITNGRTMSIIQNNVIYGCGAHGIKQNSQLGLEGIVIMGNIIRDNTSNGIYMKLQGGAFVNFIQSNVFHDNGGDGIEMQSTVGVNYGPVSIVNNIFTDNGGYGIQALGTGSDFTVWNDYNGYRGNTSGESTGITQGTGSVTLTADPYADEASNDYTLNGTSGGGVELRNSGLGYAG